MKTQIDDFAREMSTQRDLDNPLRPVFLECLDGFDALVRMGGKSNGGALPGVLVPLEVVTSGGATPTFMSHVEDQISFREIRLKVKSEGSDKPAYEGDTECKIKAFKKDVKAAFQNAISKQYHHHQQQQQQ